MAQELSLKSKEIRKYHAEQAVVFWRVWELVGQPAEMANKARLYDQMVESGDPTSARQAIPILVKYSQMMKNLFEDIHRLVPPSGTPRRVLYQGPPGSPSWHCTRPWEKWPWCTSRQRLWNQETDHGQGVPDMHRPALSKPEGRVPDPTDPEEVNLMSAGPQTGPGLQIGPER